MTTHHFTDLYSAEKHARNYDAVISLGPELEPQHRNPDSLYLYLDFDDVEIEDLDSDDIGTPPSVEDIKAIIEFVSRLDITDKLLIHCYAGYSRSSAGVLIAKCERDKKTIHQAREELYDARIPDKLIPKPNNIMVHQYLMIK